MPFMKKTSTAAPWLALILALVPATSLTAQVLAPQCGGEGESPCGFFSAELWANDSGTCDRGLTNSIDDVSFFFGKSGACVNASRKTVSKDTSWVAWALREQRNGVQGNLPINAAVTLGTHNSFSNYADGDRNQLNMNQMYSITDQMQLGARLIRIDPVFYFGELRTCHASDTGGIPVAKWCEGIAGLPSVGLAAFFTPLAIALNVLPPPLPDVLDALLIAASLYGVAEPINNRLFASTMKEVRNWLDNNPNEAIVLLMNESGQEAYHPLVNQVIQTYLGSKVFTPGDLTNAGGKWPSISKLQSMQKQVIVFNDAGNDPWSFNHSDTTAKGKRLDAIACTVDSADIIKSYKPNNNEQWIENGDGLTGANYIQAGFTGELSPSDITQSVLCGVSTFSIDFWMSLDHAFGEFARSGPDRRREASIWSYQEGDFGTAGPAVFLASTGRWNSRPPSLTMPYVCAKTTGSPYTARSEWKATGFGDFFSTGYQVDSNNQIVPLGTDVCTSLGAGWQFAAPQTAYENKQLSDALKASGTGTAWLKYTSVKIPPVVFGGDPTGYMDRGGTPPPLNITVDGFPDYAIKLVLRSDPANILDAAAIPSELLAQANSLVNGPLAMALTFNANTVQNLPTGTYVAQVDLLARIETDKVLQLAFTTYQTLFITLHVMEPTALEVSTSTNSGCPAGSTCIMARMRPSCTPMIDPLSGERAPFSPSGWITFTDIRVDGSGHPSSTPLGAMRVNGHADTPSESQTGSMNALAGCGDNVVCGWINLPPGKHSIAAQYTRDATYNSSGSNAFSIQTASTRPVIDLGTMVAGNAPAQPNLKLPSGVAEKAFAVKSVSAPFRVDQVNGPLPANITVSVDPATPPGDYSGTVSVTEFLTVFGALIPNIEIATDVRVSVTSPAAASPQPLSVIGNQTVAFTWTSSLTASTPAPQKVDISSPVAMTLTASAVTDNGVDWLRPLVTTNGNTINTVTVSGIGDGLTAGLYHGTVIVTSAGAAGPLNIPVTMKVSYNGTPTVIVTNPPGLPVIVNGTRYLGPAAVFVNAGSQVTLSIPAGYIPMGPGRRALFTGWSTGEKFHTIIVNPNATYTANFETQVQLTTIVSPTCAGTITPAGGWFKVNDFIILSPAPAPGSNFQLASFTFNNSFVILDKPKTVAVTFACPSNLSCSQAGAPFTRAAVFPPPNGAGWINSFPKVTLSADKPFSTVQSIEYSLSGAQLSGAITAPGSRVDIPITAEGITTITYLAIDPGGNREPSNTFTVKFDHSQPVMTTSFVPAPNSFGWVRSDITVNFVCSDSISGVASSPAPVHLTTEGISSANGDCTDKAGNGSGESVLVRIEKTVPTMTASVTPAAISPADGPTKTVTVQGSFKSTSGPDTVKLGASATDSAGGLTQATSCSITAAGDFTCTIPLKTSPPGSYSVLVKAGSKAGNVVTATTTVTVNK
jgi:hypothetical protein